MDSPGASLCLQGFLHRSGTRFSGFLELSSFSFGQFGRCFFAFFVLSLLYHLLEMPLPCVHPTWPELSHFQMLLGLSVHSDPCPACFSPSSFKKILQLKMVGFFICTFAALRDINSCNRSSVVSGSKLPTYRTALFTEGFFFVTYSHESSSESHTGGVVRRAHAGLSSLCRACTCWSSRERGSRRTGACATRLYGLCSPAIFSGMSFPCSLFRSSSLSSLWLSLFLSVSAPLSDEGEGTFWPLVRSAHDCAGSVPGSGFGFVFDFLGGSCSPRRRAFFSFSRNSIRSRASRYSSCFVVTSFCRALIERDNLASRSNASCRSFSSSRRTVESSSRTAWSPFENTLPRHFIPPGVPGWLFSGTLQVSHTLDSSSLDILLCLRRSRQNQSFPVRRHFFFQSRKNGVKSLLNCERS